MALPLLSDLDGPVVPRIGGRYAVDRLLASGGTAQVFQARDLTTGRTVAVKILQVVDPVSARRFRTEIEVLSWLDHPALVHMCDKGLHDGRPYLVMEMVEGPSLADVLEEDAPLAVERSLIVGQHVAEALAHAHALDIVHRDVKPENVLLDPDVEHTRLADFGIARFGDGHRMTAQGTCVGTAAYLAPEQIEGMVGPPVDVYALGLVLLECLTGEPCYEGPAVEAAMARLARPPEVPSSLPGWLSRTLRTMTARQPEDRPTAATVAESLSRHTDTGPLPVGKPPRRLRPTSGLITADVPIAARPTRALATLAAPPRFGRRVLRAASTSAAVVAATVVLWVVAGNDLKVTASSDPPLTPPVSETAPPTTTTLAPPPSAAPALVARPPTPAAAHEGEGKGADHGGKAERDHGRGKGND